MAYARAFSNSVVLPNGEVLVVGGQQHPQPFTDTGAALSPELWNPATGKFTIMAPELIPAQLPQCGDPAAGRPGVLGRRRAVRAPSARRITPTGRSSRRRISSTPTALPGRRPVIKTAPAKATTGTTITVTTNSATPKFALIRMAAVTHSLDNDQRLIPVTPIAVRGAKDKYRLNLPASKGVLLPGNYMLFALNCQRHAERGEDHQYPLAADRMTRRPVLAARPPGGRERRRRLVCDAG